MVGTQTYSSGSGSRCAKVESHLLRLTADGQPDSTFGPGGASAYAGVYEEIRRLVVDPAGRTLIGGTDDCYSGGCAVAPDELHRILADGSPDPSFTTFSDNSGDPDSI